MLPPGLSVGEKVERLAKRTVDMVVISALPPGALVPTRYLYKRIRNAYPNLEIVVGLWSQDVSAGDLKARIGADEHTRFATTLLEARSQVEQLSPGIALSKPVLLTGVAAA